MNGAEALLHTLAGCGVTVCFANPGTSEMYFVAGLDGVPELRGVILAGARPPVSFVASPGQESSLVPDGCGVHVLAALGDDVAGALAALADLAAPDAKPRPQQS